MSQQHEYRREQMKEEHHVEKHEHEEKPSGIFGKIQQVGKAGLEKVEQIYEDIVGGGHPKFEMAKQEHIKIDVPLEPRESEELRESELYRSVLKENEEDLIKSAEKIEKSRNDVFEELQKVRTFAKTTEDTFRAGADHLQQAEAQMRHEAELVGGILRENEQILDDMSQKLDNSAKRLRHEVNRIKAEEMKRAADELKIRADRLEKYAEETSSVAEMLEQRGEEQRGELRSHEQITKEGQYPAGESAQSIKAHRGEKSEKRMGGHDYYKEGYPGQVPPQEYETYATGQSSTEQLVQEPKQPYEQERVHQKERMF